MMHVFCGALIQTRPFARRDPYSHSKAVTSMMLGFHRMAASSPHFSVMATSCSGSLMGSVDSRITSRKAKFQNSASLPRKSNFSILDLIIWLLVAAPPSLISASSNYLLTLITRALMLKHNNIRCTNYPMKHEVSSRSHSWRISSFSAICPRESSIWLILARCYNRQQAPVRSYR